MNLVLEGKRIFVAGGTRGIGLYVAKAFIGEGARVAVCGRNKGNIEAAKAELREDGDAVRVLTLDATDPAAVDSALGILERAWGGLDIVVTTLSAMKMQATDEDWNETFRVDLIGNVQLLRRVMPMLKKSGNGAIVIVGSTASSETHPQAVAMFGGEQPYGAAKAALVHLAKNLAVEAAPSNVRVNVVSPGNIFIPGGSWDRIKSSSPEFYAAMLRENPMGRMGTPEEVANCIVFLCSPCAGFVTGQNLVVDGALTRRVPG
jgi:NAD(P)-dependent dehydrogenase (short-subunit alcohol dehydrogenase family)